MYFKNTVISFSLYKVVAPPRLHDGVQGKDISDIGARGNTPLFPGIVCLVADVYMSGTRPHKMNKYVLKEIGLTYSALCK